MEVTPVILIFDVGKTNKKLFLFDEHYQIVYERSARFTETVDEDGFPCENLEILKSSVFDALREVFKLKQFWVKAINFSTYGASLVFIDDNGKPLTPLYNYLKTYPQELSSELYNSYGGENKFAADTASPALGSLNSGLVLYRLKQQRPEIFKQLKFALHLPQYLSFLITGIPCTDITSIGCHTAMWDFNNNGYHKWITREGIYLKLAPIKRYDQLYKSSFEGHDFLTGTGLHDSSAALIPYLVNFSEPFILLSTGTWCISMNPFNHSPLTGSELKNDCLCYLHYQGKPVKASRLFAGYEHEQQVKRIADHFNISTTGFRNIKFNAGLLTELQQIIPPYKPSDAFLKKSAFKDRDLSVFKNETEAYYQLIVDLVHQQVYSTQMVLKDTGVKRIFIDGGFSKNLIYMNILANAFPNLEVYAASVAQASAIGAAMAIHDSWNNLPLAKDIIKLKRYTQATPTI